MIQTQLLRLDPPYQIISAGGQVGIQIATLIVTEDKQNKNGGYDIDTHSHPVVCYGLKEGLVEEFKYGGCSFDEINNREQRLQPEGAVWNKVEINDIRVLGIAGANNNHISLETFVYLVPPSATYMPYRRVWDEKSIAKMYDLLFGFGRVGLRCVRMKWTKSNDYETRQMCITLEENDGNNPFVHVIIMDNADDPYKSEIGFRLCLYNGKNSIDDCVNNIVHVVKELKIWFVEGRIDEKFVYWHDGATTKYDADMEALISRVNKAL